MLPKKRINEQKSSANSTIKHSTMAKSISLIINPPHLTSNNASKRYHNNNHKKSNSVEKPSKNSSKYSKNKKSSKIYYLSLPRQNSQGVLYSLKNYSNDAQLTQINQKYKRLDSHILSETKTPKIIELLNNKIKGKKNYLETYNNNSNKDNNIYSKKTSLSLAHKKKNLSQGNMDYINFDEFYNYNLFKKSRNQKMVKKIIKENDKTHKNKYERYDRNKCIIERKIYGGEKQNKKSKDKMEENNTLPNNCDSIYNKILFNNIKLNINKELNLNSIKKTEKNITNINKNINSINLKTQNDANSKYNDNRQSSFKLLIKSNTNNILNTSIEDLKQNNKEKINKNNKDNKDIKLIFPPFNKCDINNESSQESTNQMGNTFSNKVTINSNFGYRKEKFISSFLDGPEDIHCRFVELHKQRKMFYENLCNKLEDESKSIDNDKAIVNDFEKNEYSEYFDNYNENVPII